MLLAFGIISDDRLSIVIPHHRPAAFFRFCIAFVAAARRGLEATAPAADSSFLPTGIGEPLPCLVEEVR